LAVQGANLTDAAIHCRAAARICRLLKLQSNAHFKIKVRTSVALSYEASETSMSIGSIASSIYQQYPIGMIGITNPSSGAGAASAPAPTSTPGAAQSPPAGGLFDALMQALTQSGALTSTTAATAAAGTSATSTTTDAKATSAIGAGATSASDTSAAASGTKTPQQAMQAFIQNLVSALQSQGAATATAAGTSATATAATTSGTAAPSVRHGHGGHGGHMSAALQDLIDDVDSTNSTATTSAAATGTAATAATSTSASGLASLQQSFQNLVSTMGGSANASLSGFLTNFASDLSGMSAVGNLVNTQA
jgi:protocadherin Fat 4